MSRHDSAPANRRMRDHDELLTFMHGRVRGDWVADRVLALAVIRLVEIFGDAAHRVPSRNVLVVLTLVAVAWAIVSTDPPHVGVHLTPLRGGACSLHAIFSSYAEFACNFV
jgi:hypothetical protein